MSNADDFLREPKRRARSEPEPEPEKPNALPLVSQGGRSERPGPRRATPDDLLRGYGSRGRPVWERVA